MKRKSVREMSTLERGHNSLATKLLRAVVRHTLFLGLLCFLLGLVMYMNALMQQTMQSAAESARTIVERVCTEVDPAGYASRAMEIYYRWAGTKLTEENRAAYYAAYTEIAADPGYQKMRGLLREQRTTEMSHCFLAVADEKTGVLLFVADTDPRPGHEYPLGEAVKVPAWVQRLFFSGGSFPRLFCYLPKRGLLCISGAFVRQGDPSAGFLFVMSRAEQSLEGISRFAVLFVALVLFAAAIVGGRLARRTRRAVLDPINRIADAARRYVEDKRNGTGVTGHFSGLNIRTGDEVENLCLMMSDMEKDLAEYESNLTSMTAEKERIATELNLAARIQTHMLPSTFPAFPDRREFDIFACMTPAKEVGGDFYDFFMVDEDHLAMVIADVSGKGVPAALFMMASRTMLKGAAQSHQDPASVLERVNRQLCESNPDLMFVTVWLGILEISTGELVWADAGHERLCLYQSGKWECLPKQNGVALAAFEPELLEMEEESPFQNHTLHLKAGDVLFQYTDGVTEAMTAEREQFGMERMMDALRSAANIEPEALLPHIRERIDAFVCGAPQNDDITMLALQYRVVK